MITSFRTRSVSCPLASLSAESRGVDRGRSRTRSVNGRGSDSVVVVTSPTAKEKMSCSATHILKSGKPTTQSTIRACKPFPAMSKRFDRSPRMIFRLRITTREPGWAKSWKRFKILISYLQSNNLDPRDRPTLVGILGPTSMERPSWRFRRTVLSHRLLQFN